MKMLILSDLHLEFAPFETDRAAVAAADVVVLAGDIGQGLLGIRWALAAFPTTKPVVYVAGDHEFYGHEWQLMRDHLRQACVGTNVHSLDNTAITIDGVRFLGATLWTDFMLLSTPQGSVLSREAAFMAAKRGLNDFSAIRHVGRRFRPSDALDDHQRSRRWIAERLAEPHDCPTVVVTHHAPSEHSGDKIYKGDELSPCFASNLSVEQFFGCKATLWVHGHMHNSSDYVQAGTRIVCNPRGYPRSIALGAHSGFENLAFDSQKIVEV